MQFPSTPTSWRACTRQQTLGHRALLKLPELLRRWTRLLAGGIALENLLSLVNLCGTSGFW
jgi:hypothetical protein